VHSAIYMKWPIQLNCKTDLLPRKWPLLFHCVQDLKFIIPESVNSKKTNFSFFCLSSSNSSIPESGGGVVPVCVCGKGRGVSSNRFVCVRVCVCVGVCVYMCERMCVWACLCVCARVYVCVCVWLGVERVSRYDNHERIKSNHKSTNRIWGGYD